MKNKNHFLLFLSIALIVGIVIGGFFNNRLNNNFQGHKSNPSYKIKKLLQFIKKDHIDTIDTGALLDDVIHQLVNKLDPHSVYFPKEAYLESRENMQGAFEGIGVQFFMYNDSLVVTQVLKNGPSEKAGIQAGDRILIADQDTLYNKKISNKEIVKILKGLANTSVNLSIYRKKSKEMLQIPVTRNKVAIHSAEVAYLLNNNLGYIKIDRFAMTTFDEFKKNINSLQSQGAKNLVLDLRQNGGGYIHIATKIADEFLKEGKRICFTKNNKGKIKEFYATSKGDFQERKIYVLIDEGSASASEIVAGALQDNDVGVIVGRRSFGKGLVQEEMQLGDGSAVRLTVAKYYTPTGRSIQKPYHLNDAINYAKEYQERILGGELLNKDSIKVIDSLKFKTPKGKIVYGGGGIIPDVFVSIDTISYLKNHDFENLNLFSFEFVDKKRTALKNLDFDEFVKTFSKNEAILNAYLKYIKYSKKITTAKRKSLNCYIMALVAREIFDETAFYKMHQKQDKMILKVLKLEKQKN